MDGTADRRCIVATGLAGLERCTECEHQNSCDCGPHKNLLWLPATTTNTNGTQPCQIVRRRTGAGTLAPLAIKVFRRCKTFSARSASATRRALHRTAHDRGRINPDGTSRGIRRTLDTYRGPIAVSAARRVNGTFPARPTVGCFVSPPGVPSAQARPTPQATVYLAYGQRQEENDNGVSAAASRISSASGTYWARLRRARMSAFHTICVAAYPCGQSARGVLIRR